jgi:hypothetical protein
LQIGVGFRVETRVGLGDLGLEFRIRSIASNAARSAAMRSGGTRGVVRIKRPTAPTLVAATNSNTASTATCTPNER